MTSNDMLEIAVLHRPCRGEKICGDVSVIAEGGGTLIALADGLGHGPAAAEAAQAFCDHVEQHATEGLDTMLEGASRAITRTRGVAAAVVRIDGEAQRLGFAGVGNIELKAVSAEPIHPVSLPGIIGKRMRKVRQFEYRLHGGDLLVLFSDGISSRLDLKSYRNATPAQVAEAILAEHGKDHDDASCIAIRVRRP